MTSSFWKHEADKRKAKETNRILVETEKSARELAPPKHPKELYIECLKNSAEWRHYSASAEFTIDDLAMYACKNVGCAINYCGLIKTGVESEWRGSSDCTEEIAAFNKCMVDERRRYAWMDSTTRPPMYEYLQQRIKEKTLENKFNLLSEDEGRRLRKELQPVQQLEETKLEEPKTPINL